MTMADAPCRHEWTDMSVHGEQQIVWFCGKCATYRFDPPIKMPRVPEGDLYYLEETRENEG